MIILAHAADTNALAATVCRRLSGLGYAVEQRLVTSGKGLEDNIAQAQRLVVLWSKGAASANLDASLKRADQAGKLSIVRLASSPTPARLKRASQRLPRAGESDGAWRRLAENGAAPPVSEPRGAHREHPGSRLHGLIVLAAMGLVVVSAAYLASPDFAQNIDTLFDR